MLAERHIVDGRLRRVSRDGVVGEPVGVLEDYGCVAEAFCAVHQLTGDGRWLDLARQLLDVALAHFRTGQGGFYDTADDAERLVTRPADPTDNATPSGRRRSARRWSAYAALSGETSYREAADAALETLGAADRRARAVRRVLGGGRRGGAGRPVRDRHRHPRSARPIRWSRPRTGTPRRAPSWWPASRTAPACRCWQTARSRNDGSTAYVCRGFVCDRPVTSRSTP